MSDTEIVYAGYTHDELGDAFDRVKDKDYWKNPINATIKQEDYTVTAAAIIFFAGSNTEYQDNGDGTLTISAPGYYVDIGS